MLTMMTRPNAAVPQPRAAVPQAPTPRAHAAKAAELANSAVTIGQVAA